jgi:hypothetical protein
LSPEWRRYGSGTGPQFCGVTVSMATGRQGGPQISTFSSLGAA